MKAFDVAVVGAGVLGSALAAEASRLGFSTVSVGPLDSPSFAAGTFFRLNTWLGHREHPALEPLMRRTVRATFPRADVLVEAAHELLQESGVVRSARPVRRIDPVSVGGRDGFVLKLSGGGRLGARRVLLCLGWGEPKVLDGPAGTRVRVALEHRRAFSFTPALQRLADGRFEGPIAVVGAGPGALSFLEAALGQGPSPSTKTRVPLVWVSGPGARPPATPRLAAMFEARWGALVRRAARIEVRQRVVDVHERKGFTLLLEQGDHLHVRDLVWCCGFDAPLSLLGSHHRPLVVDGVHLGLQRTSGRRGLDVVQVGPALDQLGLADFDQGPYAEWFEKGSRLLKRWKRAD